MSLRLSVFVRTASLLTLLLLAPATPAWAGPSGGHVIEARGEVTIDWSLGVARARGASAGDLRAPSAAVARVGAERTARATARELLVHTAAGLVLADGRAVEAATGNDAAATARLEAALDQTRLAHADYGTDGSVVVAEELPLEAVRLAVAGAPAPPPEPDGPTAVLVDARKALDGPVLGLSLSAGGERYAGPTIFYRDAAAARADVRLGERVEEARATSRDGETLALADGADVARLRRAGALVVVLLPVKR